MCVVLEKNDMANEIAGFGNWWSEFFFLVTFSEFIVKCVIRFGRFVRILEDQWKC